MRGDQSLKKVCFHTLGCKLNFAETSTLAREFIGGGFKVVSGKEEADVCVVNTCSVTEHADKKCRNLIRKLIRENPGALIAVTGCYAQLKPDDIAAIEGVSIVAGNNGKGGLFEKVSVMLSGKPGLGNAAKEFLPCRTSASGKACGPDGPLVYACGRGQVSGFFPAFSTGGRTRAFLKVQDGCNYKCSYCTIPYARGESRNLPVAELVAQAEQIAAGGQKEIVITGINTGDFGRTTGESFACLLKALGSVAGIERYRISSIEPNLLTDEIIAITAGNGKFMPHFHIPLQSGSDTVLGKMRRRYTTAVFAERIESVRRALPDAFIGIDVITGFPGEDDKEFRTTYDFLENLAPSYLHVFPYSERPGTPAVDFPGKISKNVSAERVKALTSLCGKLHREFTGRYIGRKVPVLFESTVRNGVMSGFSDNYIRVKTLYDRSSVNEIRTVELERLLENGDAEGIIIP